MLSFLADRVTAPVDADTAVVGLIDPFHNLFHRHFSTELQPLGDLLESVPLDSQLPLIDAARTGVAVLLEDRAQVEADYPDALPVFDAGGIVAAASLPMRNRTGVAFGALGVAWRRPVVFDQRLRFLLATIAELAAQTLERAWLADASEVERSRAEHLSRLAEALALTQSKEDVEQVISERAAMVVGAESSAFVLSAARGGPSEVEDASGDGAGPAENGVLTMSVLASDAEPFGTLVFDWGEPVQVDDGLSSTFTTVVELVAQTLERVDLAEAEHRLIEELQRRIIRPLPVVGDLEVAARYEPAAARLGMGGDWYEGLSLDDGARMGLIVGDVVGHGVESAVEMTQLSGVLSTLVRVGVPLDALFARVHEVVHTPTIYATALVGVLDLATSRLELSSAGHPPPVLIGPDGQASLVGGPQHPMIGVPPHRRRSVTVDFVPGSTLVAFTDGLVERRYEPLDDGLERLRVMCSCNWRLPADELVDLIISSFVGDGVAEDDLAVVVVRSPYG